MKENKKSKFLDNQKNEINEQMLTQTKESISQFNARKPAMLNQGWVRRPRHVNISRGSLQAFAKLVKHKLNFSHFQSASLYTGLSQKHQDQLSPAKLQLELETTKRCRYSSEHYLIWNSLDKLKNKDIVE